MARLALFSSTGGGKYKGEGVKSVKTKGFAVLQSIQSSREHKKKLLPIVLCTLSCIFFLIFEIVKENNKMFHLRIAT